MFYADGTYTYQGTTGIFKFYDKNGDGVITNPDGSEKHVSTDSEGNRWGYDSAGNAFYTDVNDNKWTVDKYGVQ